ncbi:hypothetical protein VC83_08231 [Pseudogymnoascus destructans]|uniref:J domain-containing protein n=2 Tax=Pseudogymnoascus destructans TaxID=655981 RepID=L8FX24_PSED2|nr:uncharacterized protein VC83_08231 [Pseudogymnoascus destructans]ELR05515.1 hypothetical protein GMDG_07437 [Pseudogymnoascus destructans 20631-21]OAF55271.1 hypothetical protein VC83_08231 [Pseudogymnoascus destructans]
MSLPLPPDPYKALGVAKDAAISEVKSAYRKLVLKCHPDKVQDPTLKAQKQDEFQKVQQAYELLTDDTKRTEYDEKMRMFVFRDTLRSQAPKSSPQSARSSPQTHNPPVFDYEVRTAEPRLSRFKTSRAPSPVRVYATARPASFEDDLPPRMYDVGSGPRSARKAASYEDRKAPSREDERHQRLGEERERQRREKDLNKKNLSASKKSRDKERRKGVEEKTSSRRTPFIVDGDHSDEFPSPRSERRSGKRSDDKIRVTMKGGETNEFIVTERTRKLQQTNESAAQYILKSKSKGKSPEAEFRPPTIRRSETYHSPPYATRYPVPPPQTYIEADSEDDSRRSSARPRSRRPSDALPPRIPLGNEPYIITADPSSRKPSLQSHSSAPPLVAEPRRKEPQRAQTIQSDYTRRSPALAVPPPPLPRAATFNGEKPRPHRAQTEYYPPSSDSSDSDSDGHVRYASPSRAPRTSPPIQTGTQKRYVVEKSRAVPVARSSHRKVLRDDSFVSGRDRSESPRGTPSRVPDRPPLTRSSTSSARASSSARGSSRAPTYYAPPTDDAPPRSKRDVPRGVQQQSSPGGGSFFGEVKYAPAFRPEDVTYGEYYRPGQTTDYYPQSRRGEAAAAYA